MRFNIFVRRLQPVISSHSQHLSRVIGWCGHRAIIFGGSSHRGCCSHRITAICCSWFCCLFGWHSSYSSCSCCCCRSSLFRCGRRCGCGCCCRRCCCCSKVRTMVIHCVLVLLNRTIFSCQ